MELSNSIGIERPDPVWSEWAIVSTIGDRDLVQILRGLEVLQLGFLMDDGHFHELHVAADASYPYAMEEAARRVLARGHTIEVTDECGENAITIVGLAEFALRFEEMDDIVEERGFKVRGSRGEYVTQYLSKEHRNDFGLGEGIWDEQFHTIKCCGACGAEGVAEALGLL